MTITTTIVHGENDENDDDDGGNEDDPLVLFRLIKKTTGIRRIVRIATSKNKYDERVVRTANQVLIQIFFIYSWGKKTKTSPQTQGHPPYFCVNGFDRYTGLFFSILF